MVPNRNVLSGVWSSWVDVDAIVTDSEGTARYQATLTARCHVLGVAFATPGTMFAAMNHITPTGQPQAWVCGVDSSTNTAIYVPIEQPAPATVDISVYCADPDTQVRTIVFYRE